MCFASKHLIQNLKHGVPFFRNPCSLVFPPFVFFHSLDISSYLAEIAEQRIFDMHKKGKSNAISTEMKKKKKTIIEYETWVSVFVDPLLFTSNTKQSPQ